MICLKNRTFAVSQTTPHPPDPHPNRLWFAWKIVLLQYRKQLIESKRSTNRCCDLLEKSYFCSIANNRYGLWGDDVAVVICLKNRTFAVSQTTLLVRPYIDIPLWFAWKIVLLQYRKQQRHVVATPPLVVICLKNRTFAVSQTTGLDQHQSTCRLWFAWKIVLLQYRKQLNFSSKGRSSSCDLLEKSYFCSIANNCLYWLWIWISVVICLKNRTFAVSQTTIVIYLFPSR